MAVHYAINLLIFLLFSPVDAFFGSKSLRALDNNKVLERDAVQQAQSSTTAPPPVLVLLSHEVSQPLHTEPSAEEHRRVVELSNERSATSPPAKFAEVRLCPKDHLPLLYRAEAPPSAFVDKSSVTKGALSSSVMTLERRSTKVLRSGPDEKILKAGWEAFAKMTAFIAETLRVSDATQPEAQSAFQVLEVAMREY